MKLNLRPIYASRLMLSLGSDLVYWRTLENRRGAARLIREFLEDAPPRDREWLVTILRDGVRIAKGAGGAIRRAA